MRSRLTAVLAFAALSAVGFVLAWWTPASHSAVHVHGVVRDSNGEIEYDWTPLTPTTGRLELDWSGVDPSLVDDGFILLNDDGSTTDQPGGPILTTACRNNTCNSSTSASFDFYILVHTQGGKGSTKEILPVPPTHEWYLQVVMYAHQTTKKCFPSCLSNIVLFDANGTSATTTTRTTTTMTTSTTQTPLTKLTDDTWCCAITHGTVVYEPPADTKLALQWTAPARDLCGDRAYVGNSVAANGSILGTAPVYGSWTGCGTSVGFGGDGKWIADNVDLHRTVYVQIRFTCNGSNCLGAQPGQFVLGDALVVSFVNVPWTTTAETTTAATTTTVAHVCDVPDVRGLTAAAARKAIELAYCKPFAVKHAYSATVKKGVVISQTPLPHKRAPQGLVSIVVSLGPKR